MKEYIFVVDKSSPRLSLVFNGLKSKGYKVFEYGQTLPFDEKNAYIYLFSPAKVLSEEEENGLKSGSVVIGTNGREVKRKDLVFPKAQDENYLYFNNLITAEGALGICIENTPRALFEQKVLIIGYGRLGRALEKVFTPLVEEISVCTFNQNKMSISGGVRYFAKDVLMRANEYDIVLNTVPENLFSKEELDFFKEGCLFVELASVRCISDKDAEYARFRYLPAPRLPDKTAPETAADEYEKHIFSLLRSLGE